MTNLSLLQNCNQQDIKLDPFPHIIIENALPDKIAKSLTKTFPINIFNLESNNRRLNCSSFQVQQTKQINNLWKEFIRYHSSESFYAELIELFKPAFLKDDYIRYKKKCVGIRGRDSKDENKILLDAQISINTPVNFSTAVRSAHTDNTNKLFSGLFYLRMPDDSSVGGNLRLLKWRDAYSHYDKLKLYKEGLEDKHFSVFKEVNYANNVAVIFLNSLDAIHLVTPRHKTNYPRCFVNLVGELTHDVFQNQTVNQKVMHKLQNIYFSTFKRKKG